ncbi:MAG: GNAT family N-acetyltransferase [Vulcanimicrobiota bacterium]
MLSLLRRPPEWPVRSQDGRLAIRPLRSYDLAEIGRWLEDPQILRLAFGTEQDDQTVLKLGKIYLAEMDAARSSMLGICDSLERLMGFVRFAFFQGDLGRNARIGILLGKKESWGQGLGTSAVQLTLYFLFERKGVRRIELDTAEFNARAQRCFRKCGFESIPRDRRQPWMESTDPTPKVWMELTRTRWRELNGR